MLNRPSFAAPRKRAPVNQCLTTERFEIESQRCRTLSCEPDASSHLVSRQACGSSHHGAVGRVWRNGPVIRQTTESRRFQSLS
jgi:hypothetical protein